MNSEKGYPENFQAEGMNPEQIRHPENIPPQIDALEMQPGKK